MSKQQRTPSGRLALCLAVVVASIAIGGIYAYTAHHGLYVGPKLPLSGDFGMQWLQVTFWLLVLYPAGIWRARGFLSTWEAMAVQTALILIVIAGPPVMALLGIKNRLLVFVSQVGLVWMSYSLAKRITKRMQQQ